MSLKGLRFQRNKHSFILIKSSLPIPPISGLMKKRRYSETGGERSHIYNQEKPYLGLENRWRYGGGGGGEQKGGIGGDDCMCPKLKL